MKKEKRNKRNPPSDSTLNTRLSVMKKKVDQAYTVCNKVNTGCARLTNAVKRVEIGAGPNADSNNVVRHSFDKIVLPKYWASDYVDVLNEKTTNFSKENTDDSYAARVITADIRQGLQELKGSDEAKIVEQVKETLAKQKEHESKGEENTAIGSQIIQDKATDDGQRHLTNIKTSF